MLVNSTYVLEQYNQKSSTHPNIVPNPYAYFFFYGDVLKNFHAALFALNEA